MEGQKEERMRAGGGVVDLLEFPCGVVAVFLADFADQFFGELLIGQARVFIEESERAEDTELVKQEITAAGVWRRR